MGLAQPGGGDADPFSPLPTAGDSSGPAPASAQTAADPPRALPAPQGSPAPPSPPTAEQPPCRGRRRPQPKATRSIADMPPPPPRLRSRRREGGLL